MNRDWRRPVTVAVCGWAALSIATNQRWTVSYTLHRFGHRRWNVPALALLGYLAWHWLGEMPRSCPVCGRVHASPA